MFRNVIADVIHLVLVLYLSFTARLYELASIGQDISPQLSILAWGRASRHVPFRDIRLLYKRSLLLIISW